MLQANTTSLTALNQLVLNSISMIAIIDIGIMQRLLAPFTAQRQTLPSSTSMITIIAIATTRRVFASYMGCIGNGPKVKFDNVYLHCHDNPKSVCVKISRSYNLLRNLNSNSSTRCDARNQLAFVCQSDSQAENGDQTIPLTTTDAR